MEEKKIPDFETIQAAVEGQQWAVEKILECYSDEIDRLSTTKKERPDGSVETVVDEDLKQQLITGLLEFIPKFAMEES